MTNREYLNTLDDMHFAIAILKKVWGIVNHTETDFLDWLAEEYKENEE